MRNQRADVPCDGCVACCRGELIMLHPEHGDDPARYDTIAVRDEGGAGTSLALRHKPNGDCIYLGPSGCTIHDHAPAICRTFDCRRFYLKFDSRGRKALIRANDGSHEMLRAGKARLHTLRRAVG